MITLTSTTGAPALELGRREWEALLLVALNHGWRPAGTVHDERSGWDRGYHEPRRQRVTAADAAALAWAVTSAQTKAARSAGSARDLCAIRDEMHRAINETLASAPQVEIEDAPGPALQRLGLTLSEAWQALVALDAALLVRGDEDAELLRDLARLASAGGFYID